MEQGSKVLDLIILAVIALGLTGVLLTCVRVILNKFKQDNLKYFKYDVKVTVCMMILLSSIYMGFFLKRLVMYKGLEFSPIIGWTFYVGVIPYSLVVSIVCGIKRKMIFLSTVLTSMFIIAIFVLSILLP